MPYRVRADALSPDAPIPRDASLIVLDASGRAGRAGAPGARGGDGAGSGASGGNGGPAGLAEAGQDAGSVRVELAESAEPETVALSGFAVQAGGARQPISVDVRFGTAGFIDLWASGGQGGAGGVGGRGGDGARGYSGRDATRYSSGTDGGSGGSGGHGGDGTSGAPGGRGGHVHVVVDERDTHLLMLVRPHVAGGMGGAAGRNGDGGSGGAGGPGGSSYSWTETESYTDAQGNRQTRTRHRSNPGGRSGSSGISGSPGRAVLYPGSNGPVGTFTIDVKGPKGSQRYERPFDLRLESFELANENDDGVYEPGERVLVRNVQVRNVGGMPTPATRPIELSLRSAGRVLPEGEPLVMRHSLAAGASHCFTDAALTFTIGDYRPVGPEDPFECSERVPHRAWLPAVQREFTRYETADTERLGTIVVQFPVRASPVVSLASLSPGQVSRVRWTLTNRSQKPLGSRSPSGRAVVARLFARDSELGDDHAALLAPDGQRVPLADGLRFEVPELGPGQQRAFEVALGVLRNAPGYRSVNLWLSIELGPIGDPPRARPIQITSRNVRVGERYVGRAGTDLLLVVNHRTTREEIACWQRLADELGLVMNRWDLSVEGKLDLSTHQGSSGSLLDQIRGGTVVLLNNEIEVGGSETSPARLLAKDDLYRADAADVNVAVLGAPWKLDEALVPTDLARLAVAAGPSSDAAASSSAPRRERTAARPAVASAHAGEEGGPLLAPHELVDQAVAAPSDRAAPWHAAPTRWRLKGRTPTVAMTAAVASGVAGDLARRAPDRRFIVVWRHAPVAERRWLLWERFRLGTLRALPTLRASAGRWLCAVVPSEHLHDPTYVLSESNRLTLLLTLPFARKLELLGELLGQAGLPALSAPSSPAAAEARLPRAASGDVSVGVPRRLSLLAHALLVDLCNEQLAVLTSRWRSGLSGGQLDGALATLGRLAAFRRGADPPIDAASEAGGAIVALCARFVFFAKSQCRFWEWLPPLPWIRRAPMLRRRALGRIDEFVRAVFGPMGGRSDESARRNLRSARRFVRRGVRELQRRFEADRKSGDTACFRASDYSRELLLRPILAPHVTTDAEILTRADQRILAEGDYVTLVARDGKAALRRRRLERANERASADLGLSQSCEDLIGPPGARSSR